MPTTHRDALRLISAIRGKHSHGTGAGQYSRLEPCASCVAAAALAADHTGEDAERLLVEWYALFGGSAHQGEGLAARLGKTFAADTEEGRRERMLSLEQRTRAFFGEPDRWAYRPAKHETWTCDACGESIPALAGCVLIRRQDTPEIESEFAICQRCEAAIRAIPPSIT